MKRKRFPQVAGFLAPIFTVATVPPVVVDVASVGAFVAVLISFRMTRRPVPPPLWLLVACIAVAGVRSPSFALGLIVAVVIGGKLGRRPDVVAHVLTGFAWGAALSASVAVTDYLGLTGLASKVFQVGEAGLSSSRSLLAVEVGLGLLICLHHQMRYRWVAAVPLGLGLLVAGGRGGLVALAVAHLAGALLSMNGRRIARVAVGGVLVAVLLGSISLPSVDRLFARDERQQTSADAYTSGRLTTYEESISRSLRDPLGDGLAATAADDGTRAHNVLILSLQAGGLVFASVTAWLLVSGTIRARLLLRQSGTYGHLCAFVFLYLAAWSMFSTGGFSGGRRMTLFAVAYTACRNAKRLPQPKPGEPMQVCPPAGIQYPQGV